MKKILSVLLAMSLSILAVACSNTGSNETTITSTANESQLSSTSETNDGDASTASSESSESSEETTASTETGDKTKPSTDRAGNEILIPDEIEKIASLAGAFTQVLVDLGYEEEIVAIDLYSVGFEGVDTAVPAIDMMSPDIETLLSLDLDIIFASNISDAGSEDSIFQPLIDAGVTVAYIPTANSLEDIKLDIEFIGHALAAYEETELLLSNYSEQLREIQTIAETIPAEEEKSVLFEISAVPAIYSTGSGTFLDEIIELVAATNVLADETAWVPVSEEAAIALNPDVILTNVNYIDDPIAEILGRSGWEAVTAVQNEAVHSIDNNASSLPNHNVVDAAWAIARAVYPEYYN